MLKITSIEVCQDIPQIELVLMKRDGITQSEAHSKVVQTRRLVKPLLSVGKFSRAEEVLHEELGLEPEYIADVL